MRTLIVDDEEDMRALIRASIRAANQGLSVAAEAASGEEAIDFCREHPPDAVVLDHRMPGLSGLETAERILADHPQQVIILFSAYLTDEIVRFASGLGIRECISKADFPKVPEALLRFRPAV